MPAVAELAVQADDTGTADSGVFLERPLRVCVPSLGASASAAGVELGTGAAETPPALRVLDPDGHILDLFEA